MLWWVGPCLLYPYWVAMIDCPTLLPLNFPSKYLFNVLLTCLLRSFLRNIVISFFEMNLSKFLGIIILGLTLKIYLVRNTFNWNECLGMKEPMLSLSVPRLHSIFLMFTRVTCQADMILLRSGLIINDTLFYCERHYNH